MSLVRSHIHHLESKLLPKKSRNVPNTIRAQDLLILENLAKTVEIDLMPKNVRA